MARLGRPPVYDWDSVRDLLGHFPDAEIAQILDTSAKVVATHRRRRGISSAAERQDRARNLAKNKTTLRRSRSRIDWASVAGLRTTSATELAARLGCSVVSVYTARARLFGTGCRAPSRYEHIRNVFVSAKLSLEFAQQGFDPDDVSIWVTNKSYRLTVPGRAKPVSIPRSKPVTYLMSRIQRLMTREPHPA